MSLRSLAFVGIGVLSLAASLAAEEQPAPTQEQLTFFETKVRPVLVMHCFECDSRADEWTPGSPLPERRAGGGLAIAQGRLHYFGGYKPDRDTVCADHWSLPLKGDGDWTREADMPNPRGHLSAAVLDGQIYALGGANGHDKKQVDQPFCDRYDPATKRWTPIANLPDGRSHFEGSTIVHKGRIIVVAGRCNGSRPPRGNVSDILDCFSERDHLPSEWHQGWGHGHLFDSIALQCAIQMNGAIGEHGQKAAFALAWNCLIDNRRTFEADLAVTRRGDLCNNYAIGNTLAGSGQARTATALTQDGPGTLGSVDSSGKYLLPRSLYLAQLHDRLGANAVKAVATKAQIAGARGVVWKELAAAYSELPLYADPDTAPWPGLENWVVRYPDHGADEKSNP